MTTKVLTGNIKKNYIVKPANLKGIGGFVFDIEGGTQIDLASDITDHYVEDNTSVQDHIAVKPVRITLKGYQGELVYKRNRLINNIPLQRLDLKLNKFNQLIPVLSPGAAQAKETIEQGLQAIDNLYDKVDRIANLWDYVKNLNPSATKQAQAYLYFENIWRNRKLVSVETPYKFFPSMAIESVTAKQSEDSRYISDFSITLKEFRTTELDFVDFDLEQFQSKTLQQRQAQVDNGKAQGTTVDKSLLLEGFNFVRGASR